MKKLELEFKSFYSPDIPAFKEWEPQREEEVCFLLEFEIGEINSDSSLLFWVNVATEKGLDFYKSKFPMAVYKKVILIEMYDWNHINQKLNEILYNCSSDTFENSIIRLCNYFSFEYE